MVGTLLGSIVSILAFGAVAYFAWYRLPAQTLHWANNPPWHWVFAWFAFVLLLLAPILVVMGATPLRQAAKSGATRDLLWEAVAFVGALLVVVLLLWAFMSRPAWWAGWHWWLWGAAVVVGAVASAAGRMVGTVADARALKARPGFSEEWKFNHGDASAPPALGVAMSGGGIRSAAFNIGVLHALHESGILRRVDVMSAVSGGSYAMSWYLLQPYYACQEAARAGQEIDVSEVIDEMFRSDGVAQKYLTRDPHVVEWIGLGVGAVMDVTYFQPLRAISVLLGNVELFNKCSSVRQEYRERLQRLFQGRPSPSSDFAITNAIDQQLQQELNLDSSDVSCVAPVNYRALAEFQKLHRLPFFIFNCAVLVSRAHRHMLRPTAFEWTALDVGSDVSGYTRWDELTKWEVNETRPKGANLFKWADRGSDADKEHRRHRWVLMANLAPAISGAALGLANFDPKKSARKMRLTTWTPYASNLDLGYLLSREIWNDKGALYVSDGGHSENLGAYALIKRQCREIIIVDAEHEKSVPYVFEGYRKLKMQLALEPEMNLTLTVEDIDLYLQAAEGEHKPTGPTPAVMTGELKPQTGNLGLRPMSVVYVKLGLDRTDLDSYPPQVSQYARNHQLFPQDPTTDQTFTSEQFIAYRELGRHVARNLGRHLATPQSVEARL